MVGRRKGGELVKKEGREALKCCVVDIIEMYDFYLCIDVNCYTYCNLDEIIYFRHKFNS